MKADIEDQYMHLDVLLMPFRMVPITSSNSIDKWVNFGNKS